MRLIISPPADGITNMATDEALLASLQPVLRLYTWDPACLSLGRAQDAGVVGDVTDIDVVRRLTGGSAVLHADEVTYCLVVDEKRLPSGVRESYKVIAEGLLAGLKALGVSASLSEGGPDGSSEVCFLDPSWHELVVDGRKLAGSAQRRQDGKVLQHGSLLLDMAAERYARCIKGVDAEEIQKRVISLKALGVDAPPEAVMKSIAEGIGKMFKETLIPSSLTTTEKERIEELKEKYKGW